MCEGDYRGRDYFEIIVGDGREKSFPPFVDFPTCVSYNNFRHTCRKVGAFMNKRGLETRKQIKKCACSLFAEKGFKQVTMKDITRQIFQEIINDILS